MKRSNKHVLVPLVLGTALVVLPLCGCKGDDGSDASITGTISGTVTNVANGGAAIVGATITLDPQVAGVNIVTGAGGTYTAAVPVGLYSVDCSATNFVTELDSVSILGGVTSTMDFGLDPVSPVVVSITGGPSDPAPGDNFDLVAAVTILDGSTVQSYSWTQTHSADATIDNGTTDTATITLGDEAAYKAALAEELEPSDRFAVLGIDPFAVEEGGLVTFECEVTTDSGSYTGDVDVHAVLDFAAWTSGLRNVPVGVPVLLSSKAQAVYDWVLTPPGGVTATLNDATTSMPWFVPPAAGLYVLTVTDESIAGPIDIEIYAGEWVGAINGVDGNGRPTTTCAAACHAAIFPEKFTEWAYSGHAEIFTNNINTGGHYSSGCFDCHTVGYNTAVANNGIDDTADYDAFYAAMFPGGNSHPDPDNWATVLADWPEQAQMANIQCENCHGPNGSDGAHIVDGHEMDDARISSSSQVCGKCHGEPLRHARFQQWELSGHGNFEVAIDEGTSGSCAKCHTAQGFLQWFENDLDTGFSTDAVDEGLIQPITCVVCHDPHNVGTISGDGNNVTMRVDGDSPPLLGGFTAFGLGHGAQCIVCHNTRRGLANDDVGLADPGNFDRAPHGGAQGDMLMGQNAFFVDTGLRGGHSYITDTCSTCHMAITDPPPDLSYNLSGTNHTFEADTSICSECHGAFDADSLIALNDATLHELALAIEYAIEQEILFHTVTNGDTLTVSGEVAGVATDVAITAASVINSIELTESHGRAAMNISVDGTLVEHVRLSSDTELLSTTETLLDNTVASNEGLNLAKACWNYFMIHNDSSHGIHNPSFVDGIFVATFDLIDTIWP